MDVNLADLARAIGADLRGDGTKCVAGVGTLTDAGSDHLTFLSNTRYRKYLAQTNAGAVLLTAADAPDCATNALIVNDPYLAFAKAAALLVPQVKPTPGVHVSAVIDPTADVDASACIGPLSFVGANVKIGPRTVIGPGCVVERDCEIGADCYLEATVTLLHGTRLGARVFIHPGVVLGADGFGFANDRGKWVKVPQLGCVRVGNDVEIGANTTIDRGALTDTVIDDGVKLDNLIQIAHNVQVGKHTAMAACVGVAGSAKIGAHCAVGGGAGILGHLELTDGVQVTAMSLVTHSLRQSGVYSSGTPIQPNGAWQKNAVRVKQLDKMARKLRELELELAQLKDKLADRD